MDQSVRLWNGTTGACIAVFGGGFGDVPSVAFSPDGSRLVSASQFGIIQLWDGATGIFIAILQGHSHRVHSLIFSSDGSRLASASYFGPVGHSDQVTSILFSPDGSILASASKDKTVWLWDGRIISGAATHEGHSSKITSVEFSPDGSRFVSVSDREVQLWNAVSGAHIGNLEGLSTSQVTRVTFSPDSSRLGVGYADNSVRRWDVRNGERCAMVVPKVSSSYGSLYTSASPNEELWLRDSTTDDYIFIIEGHPVTSSPDGSRVVSVSEFEMLLQNGRTGTPIATLEGHSDTIASITFSPDSSMFASTSFDRTARLWDSATGRHISALERIGPGASATFSTDGTIVVLSSLIEHHACGTPVMMFMFSERVL